MQNLAVELESYLSETFGLPVRVKPDLETAEKLPIFFGALYSIWETTIVGHPVILLFQRKREAVSPAQVAKHVVVARAALGRDAGRRACQAPLDTCSSSVASRPTTSIGRGRQVFEELGQTLGVLRHDGVANLR